MPSAPERAGSRITAVLLLALGLTMVSACSTDDTELVSRKALAVPGRSTSTTTLATPVGPVHTDPDGHFAMTIGPLWQPMERKAKGPMLWQVATSDDGSVPNVNVLSDTTDRPGVQFQIDAGAYQLGQAFPGGQLVDSGIVEGPSGDDLGWLEYEAHKSGFDLRFLAVVGVWDGRYSVATFTAVADQFEELRHPVGDYLFTLRPAG